MSPHECESSEHLHYCNKMHKILLRHSSPVFQQKFLHNPMPSISDKFFLTDDRRKDDSPQSKACRPAEGNADGKDGARRYGLAPAGPASQGHFRAVHPIIGQTVTDLSFPSSSAKRGLQSPKNLQSIIILKHKTVNE